MTIDELKELEAPKVIQMLHGIYNTEMIDVSTFGLGDFFLIMSRGRSNDLLHWFEDNAGRLESNLIEMGYTWCYAIESVPPDAKDKYHPFMYMFVGKDISQITVREFLANVNGCRVQDITCSLHDGSIEDIDLTQYYSPAEKAILDNADLILKLKTEPPFDKTKSKINVMRIRHLSQEKRFFEETKKEKNPQEVPEELRSDKAKEILDKLHKCGYLDEEFCPSRLSMPKMAVLAFLASQKIWGTTKWKPFEDYWGVKNIKSYYQRALSQRQTNDFMDDVKKALQ